MRIRRRPLLLSLSSYYSSSSSSDPCLQQPAKEESVADGEKRRKEVAERVHPDGDLPVDPLVQDLLPHHKSNPDEAIMEEKIQELDDPSSQKTFRQVMCSGGSSGAIVSMGWCNGESAVLLPTKRRLEKNANVVGNCSSDGVVVRGEEEKGKKRKSTPSVLMEGSRCSRVNGRGWRCSQQTLVGYSLCEHHLGKGRIRSMNTTIRGGRSRSSATRKLKKAYSSEHDDDVGTKQEEEEEERQQCLEVGDNGEKEGKKKKKIGLVRARSISSLLDETDHLAAATLSSLAAAALNI